jgi:hypothetical protein
MPIPNGTRYIIRQEGADEWMLYSRKQGEVEKMHRDTTQQGCVDYLNFFLSPNATYYDKDGNVLTPAQ